MQLARIDELFELNSIAVKKRTLTRGINARMQTGFIERQQQQTNFRIVTKLTDKNEGVSFHDIMV
jgi:DNA-binding MarR family transcriptional regulator